MKPNCIGIVTKRDDGLLKYYWCKLQFWKYSAIRLQGYEDGALSYGAYDPRYDEEILSNVEEMIK